MPLTKKFLKTLYEIPIPSHKKLALLLIRRTLGSRTKLQYMGTSGQVPLFVITERHFKDALPHQFHDKLQVIMDEMRRYMILSEFANSDSTTTQIHLTAKGVDLGESCWWERHPIWFGTLLAGTISFFSGLFLALIKHYFLEG